MKKYTEEKQREYDSYVKMYSEAPISYKGYTGANAKSLYVDEKHGVNAVANDLAASAMRTEAICTMCGPHRTNNVNKCICEQCDKCEQYSEPLMLDHNHICEDCG